VVKGSKGNWTLPEGLWILLNGLRGGACRRILIK